MEVRRTVTNTHRAYVMVNGYHHGDPSEWTWFTEPKHKMIASGSLNFCLEKSEEYKTKYPHQPPALVGIMECDTPGNPWAREWAGLPE